MVCPTLRGNEHLFRCRACARACERALKYNGAKIVRSRDAQCNTYMLLAGWEVRIVKNCDRGLENAARGRRPRAAFSRPRSQFFTIRTDPKPDNNMFIFFSCGKLSYKWVCFRSFVIELAYAPCVDSANHS